MKRVLATVISVVLLSFMVTAEAALTGAELFGSYPMGSGYGYGGSYPASSYGGTGSLNGYTIFQEPEAQVYGTQIPRFTITYLPGSYATGTPLSTEWYPGEAILAGQCFSRTGYTQTGWSYTDGGAKVFALNQHITLGGNVVLYPYWEYVTTALYLTVQYAGNGAVRLSGGNVPYGWSGKLEPGQSYTFQLVPFDGYYVYSILLAGMYRSMQYGNSYMVTYEMMQGAEPDDFLPV